RRGRVLATLSARFILVNRALTPYKRNQSSRSGYVRRRLCTMRCLCAATVLLLLPLSLCAADAPKPNTLTPKEIEEGWLLLFDGETTFGWNMQGEAKVTDGALHLGDSGQTIATTTTA